ncbi:CRS2-associated factor 2 [Forsythia ovata]|uniref:CRS2-associated factor 2 n=1 Tax=Forsythia ovata TaxID=205694 RepID=A0ABD1R5S3_9LAMI
MLKVLSWRRSILQPLLSNPNITHFPPPFLLNVSRFLSNCPPEEDLYDPPFSPTNLNKDKNKPKNTQEKKHSQKDTKQFTGNNAHNFPVKADLPFDFMYSYSENSPGVEPIGFREPTRFSPFGPGRIERKWTGTCAPAQMKVDLDKLAEKRKRVLGEPLSEEEIAELVEKYRHSDCSRQINLESESSDDWSKCTSKLGNSSLGWLICGGNFSKRMKFMIKKRKGGVTHNTLEDIHNHWKRAEAVRIKCLGVPTLDMDSICFHLEEKTGGIIIYRNINILLLFRGRNYDPKSRPVIPLMLWKPYAPIYPKLVKNVAGGLTFEETKEMRNKGLNSPPLMKLTRNGVYVNVVDRVRTAFETEEVVTLDCTHVGTSDCKKIGVKLRDLVPCVPILFKDEQIVLWKGKKDQE